MASNTARGFICKCPAVGAAPGWSVGGGLPHPQALCSPPGFSGLQGAAGDHLHLDLALHTCLLEGSTILLFLAFTSVVSVHYCTAVLGLQKNCRK